MTDENYKKGDRTAADLASNSHVAEVEFFKKLMAEELTEPWRQAMIQKEVDGFSSVSHHRSYEGRPLNLVRTKSLMKGVDVEMMYKLFH